jgi:hypothetical protein
MLYHVGSCVNLCQFGEGFLLARVDLVPAIGEVHACQETNKGFLGYEPNYTIKTLEEVNVEYVEPRNKIINNYWKAYNTKIRTTWIHP